MINIIDFLKILLKKARLDSKVYSHLWLKCFLSLPFFLVKTFFSFLVQKCFAFIFNSWEGERKVMRWRLLSSMFHFITSWKVPGKKDDDSCLRAETVALKDWIAIKFYILKKETSYCKWRLIDEAIKCEVWPKYHQASI